MKMRPLSVRTWHRRHVVMVGGLLVLLVVALSFAGLLDTTANADASPPVQRIHWSTMTDSSSHATSPAAGFHIGPGGVRAFNLPLAEGATIPSASIADSSRPTVLVAGGAGYIGSHTCVELLEAGFAVIVVDNLVNAKPESLLRVQAITGKELYFYGVDLRDEKQLDLIFMTHSPIDSVIHFAALKAVGESVAQPIRYYENNLLSTLTLLKVMQQHRVKKIVFSSSATVYGDPKTVPITEDFDLHATNPYGRTKQFIEEIIKDYAVSNKDSMSVLLRYFNPVGAHPSGKIGEDPNGIPNNLMPFISQVAVGKREKLRVFGTDWPTPDGTGVRDYIHVVDLAKGHIAALKKLTNDEKTLTESEGDGKGKVYVYNLGTGTGYSVLQMVEAMRKASGKPIEVEFADRRPGDIAECFADPAKAKKELGWTAKLGLTQMVEDAWRWQSTNPEGYPSTNDHLFKI